MKISDLEIDLVVPFVRLNDARIKKERDQCIVSAEARASLERTTKKLKVEFDSGRARHHDSGMINYMLRSVELFAPWVRRIFVLVHYPDLLPEGGFSLLSEKTKKKITFVPHALFIPGGYLPTMNSSTIEGFLGRIPELGEHFLYANDDTFFGDIVGKEDFFAINANSDGIQPIYHFQGRALPTQNFFEKNKIYRACAYRVRQTLDARIAELYKGKPPERIVDYLFPIHQIKPYTKSICLTHEKYFFLGVPPIEPFKIRSSVDIPMQLAMPNFVMATVVSQLNPVSPKDFTKLGFPDQFYHTLSGIKERNEAAYSQIRVTQPELFCLNDNKSLPPIFYEERNRFLHDYFYDDYAN